MINMKRQIKIVIKNFNFLCTSVNRASATMLNLLRNTIERNDASFECLYIRIFKPIEKLLMIIKNVSLKQNTLLKI